MKGIYLAAYKDRHYDFDIDYNDIIDLPGINVYFIGRHTYWTNIDFNFVNVPYSFDFGKRGLRLKSNCQGGENVNIVFDKWLNLVVNNKADMYQMSIFDFI